MQQEIIWQPQEGPQTALVACPIFEVFYGGARGGGKTEGSIGDWLQHSGQYGSWARGVFFRRTFKQLEQVIERTKKLYPKIGAKYNEQHSFWTMPGGGILSFRYLEKDKDAEEYQGHSYTRVYMEELTNYPFAGPLNLLRATVRSAEGIPVGLRLTGNPGGPGHHWVKQRYIDPEPKGWKILEEEVENLDGSKVKLQRVYIPSRISDNRLLWENDPLYVARLRQVGSEALVNAWLKGDWDVIDGAYFDGFKPQVDGQPYHVLPTDEWINRIPPYSLRFRAFDWGYASPFCVGWYAVSDGTWGLPDGALLKYREWYGWNGKANEGLRWTNEQIAEGIKFREMYLDSRFAGRYLREEIAYGVADPSIFSREGGPSIGEQFWIGDVGFRRGDNKRIPGWQQLQLRLKGSGGRPMIYFLDCCTHTIRTLPIMQHDEKNIEDVDTESEDHAVDETRYACMSRPWVERAPQIQVITYPKTPAELTINELVEQAKLHRLEREQSA